jgi:hypothetical protein
MMTEQRGHRQVKALLENRLVKKDPKIVGIFKIVEHDEPDHYEPYRKWLKKNDRADRPLWREKAADLWIHWTLMLIKFPVLYMNIFSRRLKTFPA